MGTVNRKDDDGLTPLMRATLSNLPQVVKHLLGRDDIQVGIANNEGLQAIHLSTKFGYPDITQLVLTHIVSVNVQTEPGFPWSGRTPLSLACECFQDEGCSIAYYVKCVQHLLDNGANVNLVNDKGCTPLHIVCCSRGVTAIVNLLLAHRAVVNKRTNDGSTPLMMACRKGFAPVVEILLQEQAKCDIQDKDGCTALSIACVFDHLLSVRLLIHNKANVNLAKQNGSAPLHVASTLGHSSCVSVLVRAKAKVNLTNKSGNTPLIKAAMFGNLECVQLLLPKSHIDITDMCGRSALHWAVISGFTKVAVTLLNGGANINLPDRDGVRAIAMAAKGGHVSCVDLLLRKGAGVLWE